MSSGPDVTFPEPTREERALQAEQLAVLRESRSLQQEQLRVQNLLLPLFFEASGFEPTFKGGRLVDIQKGPPPEEDPLSPLRAQIERGFLERSLAALEGDLPVDPALERELAEGEQTLRERLRGQLGPGFETSSPGIEALSDFSKRAAELRDAARRGDLTLAEQLGIARGAEQRAITQDFLNRLLGGAIGGANFFTGGIQGLGGISGQFNPILSRGLAQRQGQFQGRLAESQFQSQLFSDIFGAAGTIGGLGLAGGFGGGGLFQPFKTGPGLGVF